MSTSRDWEKYIHKKNSGDKNPTSHFLETTPPPQNLVADDDCINFPWTCPGHYNKWGMTEKPNCIGVCCDYVGPDGNRSSLCLVAYDDLGEELYIACESGGIACEDVVDPPKPPPEPEEDSDEEDDGPTLPTCCDGIVSCVDGYFCEPNLCICVELDPIIDDPRCCDTGGECPDGIDGLPTYCIEEQVMNDDGTSYIECHCESADCCNVSNMCEYYGNPWGITPGENDETIWGCNPDTCICENVPNPDFDPCDRPYPPGQPPPDFVVTPIDQRPTVLPPDCPIEGWDPINQIIVFIPDDGYWVWNPWTCEWDELIPECERNYPFENKSIQRIAVKGRTPAQKAADFKRMVPRKMHSCCDPSRLTCPPKYEGGNNTPSCRNVRVPSREGINPCWPHETYKKHPCEQQLSGRNCCA